MSSVERGRGATLARCLEVIELLKASRVGMTLSQLVDQVGTCPRTVRRDIDAIEAAKLPVVKVRRGRWRIVGSSYGTAGESRGAYGTVDDQ